MKSKRKAFSIFEIFLVVAILGLIAAVFIPASIIKRQHIRTSIIERQLESIVVAGKEYLEKKGGAGVSYKTLVAEDYMKPLKSVAGENYDTLLINETGGRLQVSTDYNTLVEKSY